VLNPAGADVDKDARIVVQKLGTPVDANGLRLPADLADGMHVVESGGHAWRVFVRQGDQGRIAVAQRTDLRTDAAIDSAQRTLFPLLALIPLLALLSAWVVQRALRPLRQMARSVDARRESDQPPVATPARGDGTAAPFRRRCCARAAHAHRGAEHAGGQSRAAAARSRSARAPGRAAAGPASRPRRGRAVAQPGALAG
jgi:HAMP domain-containing protein